MRRSRNGYGGYRGRRTLHDILKGIAVVLAVLVVLTLALLLWGQRFLVFTDRGPRLNLPGFSGGGETPPAASGSISVVIDESGGGEPAGGEDAGESAEPDAMLALELPLQAVLDGTAAGLLSEAGANALVLEMKSQDGTLAWASSQELAAALGVSTGTEEVNEAIRQWNQGEVYTVARVCCFRDNTVPYYRNSMALRAGNGNWKDELGLRWLHPGNEQSQIYLAQLCGELAALGFDEILLECAAFPTQGNLDRINWGDYADSTRREAAARDVLTACAQAVKPYGTLLSLRLDGQALDGAASGLTPALLEEQAGRLWTQAGQGEEQLLSQLEEAGLSIQAERVVMLTGALDSNVKLSQAVLELPPEKET